MAARATVGDHHGDRFLAVAVRAPRPRTERAVGQSSLPTRDAHHFITRAALVREPVIVSTCGGYVFRVEILRGGFETHRRCSARRRSDSECSSRIYTIQCKSTCRRARDHSVRRTTWPFRLRAIQVRLPRAPRRARARTRTPEYAWFGTRAARDGRCGWRNRDRNACRVVSLGGRFESGPNARRGVRLVPGSARPRTTTSARSATRRTFVCD